MPCATYYYISISLINLTSLNYFSHEQSSRLTGRQASSERAARARQTDLGSDPLGMGLSDVIDILTVRNGFFFTTLPT